MRLECWYMDNIRIISSNRDTKTTHFFLKSHFGLTTATLISIKSLRNKASEIKQYLKASAWANCSTCTHGQYMKRKMKVPPLDSIPLLRRRRLYRRWISVWRSCPILRFIPRGVLGDAIQRRTFHSFSFLITTEEELNWPRLNFPFKYITSGTLPKRWQVCKSVGDAGDWTRDLSHAKRTLYHWATSPYTLICNGSSSGISMSLVPLTGCRVKGGSCVRPECLRFGKDNIITVSSNVDTKTTHFFSKSLSGFTIVIIIFFCINSLCNKHRKYSSNLVRPGFFFRNPKSALLGQ